MTASAPRQVRLPINSSIQVTSCGSLWRRHSTSVRDPFAAQSDVDLSKLIRIVGIGNPFVPGNQGALRFHKSMDAFNQTFKLLMRRQFLHSCLQLLVRYWG